eukprot:s598_g15.t1
MSCVGCWQWLFGFREARRPRKGAPSVAGVLSARLSAAGSAGSGASGPGLAAAGDGDPSLFRLRCGPDYLRYGAKATPGPALYSCFGAEVLEAPCQLRSCTEGLPLPPRRAENRLLSLPHIIVVNFQLPFEAGPLRGPHPPQDHGCSVVLVFKLKESAEDCPAARLLARFLQEEGHPRPEGFSQSSCLKVVGILENLEDLGIPSVLRPIVRKFNGKPVLIEKESARYGDLSCGFVELAVDVRGFNAVARNLLRRLRSRLPQSTMQLGLLVQGVEDKELPEGFLGVARLQGLDLGRGRAVAASGETWPTRYLQSEDDKLPVTQSFRPGARWPVLAGLLPLRCCCRRARRPEN